MFVGKSSFHGLDLGSCTVKLFFVFMLESHQWPVRGDITPINGLLNRSLVIFIGAPCQEAFNLYHGWNRGTPCFPPKCWWWSLIPWHQYWKKKSMSFPKIPDPSIQWLFWGPQHHCLIQFHSSLDSFRLLNKLLQGSRIRFVKMRRGCETAQRSVNKKGLEITQIYGEIPVFTTLSLLIFWL